MNYSKLKSIAVLLLLFSYNFVHSQTKIVFDAPSWQAPYQLAIDGWGIERFIMPIDFAPKIPYAGVEDIRFTKGWGDINSPEYWSYAFLWLIDGNPEIKAWDVEKHLMYYYEGLVERNIKKHNIPLTYGNL